MIFSGAYIRQNFADSMQQLFHPITGKDFQFHVTPGAVVPYETAKSGDRLSYYIKVVYWHQDLICKAPMHIKSEGKSKFDSSCKT